MTGDNNPPPALRRTGLDPVLDTLIDDVPGLRAVMLFGENGFALTGMATAVAGLGAKEGGREVSVGRRAESPAQTAALGSSLVSAARKAVSMVSDSDAAVRSIWVRTDDRNLYCVQVNDGSYAVAVADPDVPAGLLMYRMDKWSLQASSLVAELGNFAIPSSLPEIAADTAADTAGAERGVDAGLKAVDVLPAVEVELAELGPMGAGRPEDISAESSGADSDIEFEVAALYAEGAGDSAAIAELAEAALEAGVIAADGGSDLTGVAADDFDFDFNFDEMAIAEAEVGSGEVVATDADLAVEPDVAAELDDRTGLEALADELIELEEDRPPSLSADWVVIGAELASAATVTAPSPAGAPLGFDGPPPGLGAPVGAPFNLDPPVAASAPAAAAAPVGPPVAGFGVPVGPPVVFDAPPPYAGLPRQVSESSLPASAAAPVGSPLHRAPVGVPVSFAAPPPAPVSFAAPPPAPVSFAAPPPIGAPVGSPLLGSPRPVSQVWAPAPPEADETDDAGLPGWALYGRGAASARNIPPAG